MGCCRYGRRKGLGIRWDSWGLERGWLVAVSVKEGVWGEVEEIGLAASLM